MKYLLILIFLASVFESCKRPDRNPNNINTKIETKSTTPVTRPLRNSSSTARISGANEVKMTKSGGVYEIPIKINGIAMDFIFDTGASNISISETEAYFLFKQGKLLEKDFIGSMQFMDATGEISEGTVINLRTVEIGNRVIKNVKASVVHNMKAPLLFGQSALARFGKVTIDYNKNILSLE